jgi:hypothetical protein
LMDIPVLLLGDPRRCPVHRGWADLTRAGAADPIS